MPTWTPSSDLSSFYAGRMAPPIKLPDGTYIPAPNVLSVDQIYQGILPPPVPSTPLIARSVPTYKVDSSGNPIVTSSSGPGFTADTMAATRAEQSGSRPAITQGVQPAGTVQMPPGARPSNIPLPPPLSPMQTANAAWDPFGTSSRPKDESRLPTDMGYMTGPAPNSALEAIDTLAGSGNSTMPRALPFGYGPVVPNAPASIPLTSLTGAPPSIPMPRNRPAPPMPSGTLGPITFRKGDTVSQLARDRGMTVKSFADLFGIANPDKIRAGDTVVPSVPAPRVKPPSLEASTRPAPRNSGRWAGVLDEFGMII